VPRRSEILLAQEEWLRTRDPQHIERMYNGLVRLGLFLVTQRGRRFQDPDDVRDLATDIVMRLMERGEPVIRSAPSTYLRLALWYMRKGGDGTRSLDEMEELPLPDPQETGYEDYAEDLLQRSGNDPRSDAGALVAQTLESRMDWHKVWRRIPDDNVRREYRRLMKEVELCARGSARRLDAAD